MTEITAHNEHWPRLIDVLATPSHGVPPADPAATFILQNSDGRTYSAFTGTGFTYDANGLPTAGTIAAITLHRNFDNAPMQAMSSIDIGLADVGDFLRSVSALRLEIGAIGGLDQLAGLEDGATSERVTLRNEDGTFFALDGAALSVANNAFSGTVLTVTRLDTDGTTVLSAVTLTSGGATFVSVLSALAKDVAGEQFFKLIGQGATEVQGFTPYIDDNQLAPEYLFVHLYDTDSNDTFTGQVVPGGAEEGKPYASVVDFGASDTAVTVDLANGIATHGDGEVDTLINIGGADGTNFNDTLLGSDDANGLSGNEGDDAISAGGGNDRLSGGLGDDTLDGGDGVDTAFYNGDSEHLTQGVFVSLSAGQSAGDLGVDTLISIENLVGTKFGDSLIGDEKDNEISGLDGGDVIQGGAGNDTLRGGAGVDYLYGDEGNDTLEAGSVTFDAYGNALEILVGGAGADILIAGPSPSIHYMVFYGNESGTQGVFVDLSAGTAIDTFGDTDQLVDVFGVGGTNQADTLTGSDTDDVFAPGGGTDVIDGGGGFDLISYTYSAATASDGFGFTKGIVVTMTGAGSGSIADPTGATDTFNNIEEIWGTRFGDLFTGGEGNDRFMGEAGADHFDGGAGIDTVTYFREAYSGGIAGVVVNLFTGTAFDGFNEIDTLVGIENILGTQFGDSLTGDTGDNVLSGLGGDDVINGGGGFDTLDGGDGNDSLNADAGQISGGEGNDTISTIGADVHAGGGDDFVQLVSASIGSPPAPAAPVADGGEGFDTLRINSTGLTDFTKLTNFENWEVRPGHLVTLTDENLGEMGGLKIGVAVGVHGTTGPGLTVDGSAVGAGSLTLSGSGRADVLIGGSASDHLLGSHSNDTLTGGSGDDYIDGGEDVDTAVFSGSQDDYYTILHADGTFTIVDTRDPGFDDGSDKLSGIEFLQFANGTVDAAEYAESHTLDSNTAPRFGAAAGEFTAISSPEQVNEQSVGDQYIPFISNLANDKFLVTWIDVHEGLRKGQVLDAVGNKEGGEFAIMGATTGYDSQQVQLADGRVAVLSFTGPVFGKFVGADGTLETIEIPHFGNQSGYMKAQALIGGGFVVAASVNGYVDIGVQAYDANGAKLGPQFTIPSGTYNEFVTKDIVALSDGGYVLFFDQVGGGLKAQRFDGSGNQVGTLYSVSALSSDFQGLESINSARLPDGRIVVSWAQPDAGGIEQVYARFLDAAGTPAGDVFVVNEGTASGSFPKVTVTTDGNFAILWNGEGGFRVQMFNGAGERIGDDVVVSPMIAIPWVTYAAPTPNGGIFYAWRGLDGSGEGALGRLLNSDGSFGSDVLNLGPATAGDQFGDHSAVNSRGVLVALSMDNGGFDGSGWGVFVQKFQVPGIGDSSGAVTEDGQGGALSDAGTLAFTDADSDDTHTAAASFVSTTHTSQLGTLSASVTKDSTGGATGEVSWTYNVDDEAVRFLKAGETIVETYTIALGDGNDATDSQTITITIHGKNEPPTDLTLTGAAVDENSKGGTTVGTLAAIGGGVGVTFTLTDDAGGLFVLDGNVLKVAAGAKLDHEASETQSVTVEVSEGGSEPVSRTFEIAVSDVNEAPDTLIVEGNEVEENSVPGTVVATLSATDPDEGDDTLTFSLLNNAAGLFAIVGDQIVVAEDAILDHEAAGQHTLTVEVKDAGGLSRTQDITISVLDLPEAPTDFTYTGGTIKENVAAGTVVATLAASDEDLGDTLTFTISSDPSGLFEIVGNKIRVAAGALIDYEEATEHTITVEVSDSTGNSLEQDIVVAVENVFGSFVGTSGNDTYAGTSEEDYVYGRKGNDTLSGGAGNDEIYGEEGSDTLSGGAGTDYVAGGLGNDTYLIDESDVAEDTLVEHEGEGTDTIKLSTGFASDYTLQDGFENLIAQGANSIALTGNDAANVITGNAGNNLIDGGAGADTMKGGLGNDTYVVDDAGDKVTELSSQGTDEIRTTLDVYSLAALGNVENLVFVGSGSFTGTGNSRNNVITGGSGSDVLDGKAGADTLVGGLGDDAYYIDSAADVIVEGADEGIDTVYASISYTLGADLEQLVLIGTAAINGTGNAKDNYILGNRASNILDGGAGADVLTGDFGNDIYIVDNEGDQVVEDAGQGTDTIRTSLTAYNLAATGHLENVENLTYTGSESFFGQGNTGNNVITGGHGGNTLVGGSGNDTLIGGDGTDHLDGGLGGDTMRGGKGDDIYVVDDLFDRTIKFDAFDRVVEKAGEGADTVNASVDYTLGANVENLVLFGAAVKGTGNGLANVILGNNLANTLSGAGGDDILIGEGGADTLLGGSGNDRLVISDDTFVLVDGGTGQDVLAFRSALSLDLTAIANSAIRGIEAIDISGSAGDDNLLVLGVDDVRSMSTLSNVDLATAGFGPISAENLVIFGNAGDSLSLAAGEGTFAGGVWSKVGEVTIGGEVFDVHNYVRSGTILATVAADQDVIVV